MSYLGAVEAVDERKAENSKSRALLIALTSIVVFVAVVVVTVEVLQNASLSHDHHGWKTVSKLVTAACSQTRYPNRCVSSMASCQTARDDDLADVALKVSIERAQNARDFAVSLTNDIMSERERAAWQDCVELFEDTIDRLSVCSNKGSIKKDEALIWLSAALTNQDTCLNGFRDFNLPATNSITALMSSRAVNLSELVSNSLSIYKLSTLPTNTGKNRRLLSIDDQEGGSGEMYGDVAEKGLPEWVSAGDRRLLQSSSPASQANVVVAQDGSGSYRTIAQAVNAAPQKSSKRYVIYIKAGTYKENIDISKNMKNLMFVGDGKDRTVVTGSKSVQDGVTTFKTATVAVSGHGFIARDMTFENTAGPQKHQAVALRVGADKSVVYRCRIKGYQDTLYVHSLRQLYREVDIYGTVDFVFGNAAVVIQNSNIFARRPMSNQKNTITAQGRLDPNENTGISIHNCRISAASDLVPVKGSIKTYLGRPWKQYSRTVFMQSTLDDLITPAGWLEWSGNFALKTLYYGEYRNRGVGAGTSRRVKWPGYRVITSAREAAKFSVGNFLSGNLWIPSTGIAFISGLN